MSVCVCNLTSPQAVILRDVWITNILSVAFELMEYTLEPQLPNFGECWWDHVCLCVCVFVHVGTAAAQLRRVLVGPCMSVCLCVCVFVHIGTAAAQLRRVLVGPCMSVCLCVCVFVHVGTTAAQLQRVLVGPRMSVCLSVGLCVCTRWNHSCPTSESVVMYVCLSVCLFAFNTDYFLFQWVLDFLLCNGLGIWLGLKTCQYLEMREYHWMGLYKINTLKSVIAS